MAGSNVCINVLSVSVKYFTYQTEPFTYSTISMDLFTFLNKTHVQPLAKSMDSSVLDAHSFSSKHPHTVKNIIACLLSAGYN